MISKRKTRRHYEKLARTSKKYNSDDGCIPLVVFVFSLVGSGLFIVCGWMVDTVW